MIVFKYPRNRQFTTVAFNHNASQIAAGGPSEPVIIWELATVAELRRVDRTLGHPTQSIAFHPNSPWLYISASYGLTSFNTETGELRELWGHEEFAQNVAVDPNQCRLIGARHKLWTSQRELRWLTCLDLSNSSEPVRKWDRNREFANLLTFFPDGTRFAAAHAYDYRSPLDGSSITVHMADTGDLVHTFKGEGTDAEQLAVSVDGDKLVARTNRRLYVFDLKNPADLPRELKNDGRKHFTGIVFHPCGKYLGATSNDETVKLYDTTTWEVAKTFTWNIGRMRSIAFSPDGALAAAGSDKGKVVVWDVDL